MIKFNQRSEELKGLIVSRFDLQESEPSIKLIFSNQYENLRCSHLLKELTKIVIWLLSD